MFSELNRNLSDRSTALIGVVSAYAGLRDLLRAEGLNQIVDGVARGMALSDVLARITGPAPVALIQMNASEPPAIQALTIITMIVFPSYG